jgi:DUF1680 family protein
MVLSRRSFLQSASLVGMAAFSTRLIFADGEDPLLLKAFDYRDISLAPGLAQTQFEQTQAVLLSLNDDSLLKPWRLRAGLSAPGPDMGGWYDEVPLDKTESGGHGFAPAHSTGQWISALSRGYAITGDAATRTKIVKLLDMYGPAISGKFYKNFRFPAYNYDKMVIGLIDAHRYAHVPQALELLDRTTAAAEPHLPRTALDRDDPQKRWRASVGDNTTDDFLWDESYTMPENLYIASQQGAGDRYRKMAGRYLLDKTYFEPLSENKNVLANHHAYSFCNALSSAMQAYIVTGSRMHLKAAGNGFDMITATQSFATGGWGPNESFSEPGSGALYKSLTETHRGFETPCGSYAHFKLTRYLLQVTGDGRYGDSMERVFYNTVLGAKRLEPDGHAFYYSDYNVNGSRVYFPDAWPCCSGTLPQVTADYRIIAYFHDAGGVFVNLYLPSTVKWTSSNGALVTLTQSGEYPLEGEVKLRLKLSRPSEFAVRLRVPAWSTQAQPAVVRVNGSRVPVTVQSGFATLRRKWNSGDQIELDLDLPMRLEAIDSQHSDSVALVRGPLVLFTLAQETPTVTRKQLLAASRVAGHDAWNVETGSGVLQLVPFTSVGDARYRTYLNVT